MKSIYIILTFVLLSTISFGQKKSKIVTDSITVSGNCTQCKMRIESALERTGIKVAHWDIKTKKLLITYRPDKLPKEEIHKIIASVGHDTNKVKAADSVYAKLPFCCLFRDHDPHSAEDHEKEKKAHQHH